MHRTQTWQSRASLFALAFALASTVACGGSSHESSEAVQGADAAPAAAEARAADGEFPLGLRAAFIASQQRQAGPAYRVRTSSGSMVANNSNHGFDTVFGAAGVTVRPAAEPGWDHEMDLMAVGRADARERLESRRGQQPTVQVAGNEVRYQHGDGIVEWYLNGPLGLEQGFELAQRPEGSGAELVLAMRTSGSLLPRSGKGQVDLVDSAGRTQLVYSDLYVVDAAGRGLPSRMEVTGAIVELRIDDRAAQYPVSIDPLLSSQQAKLVALEPTAGDRFGYSVAVDGDTAVIGAYWNDQPNAGFSNQGAAYVYVRSGTTWTQEQKLVATDAEADDRFATSVAIDGDTVLVGSYGDDDTADRSGAAYVFVRSGTTWTQEQKLVASDAAEGDWFGYAVGLSGDNAVVGAWRDGDAGVDTGSAYIFARSGTTWSPDGKLTATDAAAGDQFGQNVAISGTTAVIGASWSGDVGAETGAAYVFARGATDWSQQGKLLALDAAAGDRFGFSVAISGESVVVGALHDDDAADASGAAYVFLRVDSSWSQEAKLVAGDAAEADTFGVSVAISGDRVVVGANKDDDAGDSSGAAYVFVRVGVSWSQEDKFLGSDLVAGDRFGRSVAISGDTVVAGAFQDDDAGNSSGSAYVFAREAASWSQEAKLRASDAASDDRFGITVAVSGDTAVVGAPKNDDAGNNSGSAYVFIRIDSVWSQQAKLVAADIGAGQEFGASVAISGERVVVGAPYHKHATDVAGSAYVFVRSGTTWTEEDELLAGDAAASDVFGAAVSISGDRALVGAWADDDGGNASGSAYVFLRTDSSWAQEDKLVADDPLDNHGFGRALALFGDTAVVGASGDADAGSNSGAAYVFLRSGATWSQDDKLVATDAAEYSYLGSSVALDGDTVVLGAYADDHAGFYSGAAYVFVKGGSGWPQQAKLTASDAASNDIFGSSVAVSGDLALVGVQGKEATYVFSRSGSAWTEQAHLVANDGIKGDNFGSDVALSGETALVGAYTDDDAGASSGSAYLFELSDPDECLGEGGGHDCDANAACGNTYGSFTCTCNAGYSGTGVNCTDDDECAGQGSGNNCDANAACSDTAGSFTCQCLAGFTGDGTSCADLDECLGEGLGNDCDSNASCSNITGGFTCSCNAGYSGTGVSCTDDDECAGQGAGNDCDANASCSNTAGGFSCACDSGFTGNGVSCTDDDECAGQGGGHDCADDAACTNTPGGFSCACNDGFTGDGTSCAPICGDGTVAASEQCDDGNTTDGDGCSASCQLEAGGGDGADSGGCSCTAGDRPAPGSWLLALFVVLGLGRRRWRAQVVARPSHER